MKKTYTAPVIDIIEYKIEDVLLASGTGFKGLFAQLGQGEAEIDVSTLNDWFN